MAPPFDPVKLFYDEVEAFPPLGEGCVGRRMLDTDRMLVYSLGDENSQYPFCHVVVLLYGLEEFAVRFYRSTLRSAAAQLTNLVTVKEQHYHVGRRARDSGEEQRYYRVLTELRQRHGGDLLRAYQLRALVAPTADSPNALAYLVWTDVLDVLMRRMAQLLRSPAPEDLIKFARHMELRYGYDNTGCCSAALRRRWWRWRLVHRLVHHYPSLPRASLKLLADDIAYLVRYPYAPTAII